MHGLVCLAVQGVDEDEEASFASSADDVDTVFFLSFCLCRLRCARLFEVRGVDGFVRCVVDLSLCGLNTGSIALQVYKGFGRDVGCTCCFNEVLMFLVHVGLVERKKVTMIMITLTICFLSD